MKNKSADSTKKPSQAVDAVFVIGTGSRNNNEELRYALRNLDRNCPFIRDVYISGECPQWVDTSVVKHLKWPDRFSHAKDANIIDKLRHACEQPGVADRILFCSDDQFVTRTCSWDDFSPRWLRQYKKDDPWYENRKRVWHTRLHKTLERDRQRRIKEGLDQSRVYYYQPHMWMQIDREKFIEYAKWCDYEHRDDTIIASGYFNFADADGKYNFDHVFISAGQKWPVAATHIAYTDTSFSSAMDYLKKEFPDKCRFELEAANEADRKGAKADLSSSKSGASAEPVAMKLPTPMSIVDITKAVMADSGAWVSLKNEIAVAAKMHASNYSSWKLVIDDIERRFNAATGNGAMYIPVTESPSPEAKKAIDAFNSKEWKSLKQPAQPAKTCGKCAARRKQMEAEAAKNGAAPATDMHTPPMDELAEKYSCIDCALDHLSKAVAYLNSNESNPDPIDVIMARGEVFIAMRHLSGAGYDREKLECSKAIASMKSPESTFSSATFYAIIKSIMSHES